MADNNVVRFRRPEKKPDKPNNLNNPQGPAPRGPKLTPGQLSLVAWGLIIAVSVAIVAARQSGLLGG